MRPTAPAELAADRAPRRRVANFYFTVVAGLSLTEVSPVRPWTTFTPLAVVLMVSLAKEALEDWKRHKADKRENEQITEVWSKGRNGELGSWKATTWKDVGVGDIILVKRDTYLPADIVLLSAGNADGICFIETMNLDGETNLKIKQAFELTNNIPENKLDSFSAVVEYENPNASLYTFTGNVKSIVGVPGASRCPIALSPGQIILRGSSLRNTKRAIGLVIYTGQDTKVMMNATHPPSKRSILEKQIDNLVLFQFFLLFAFCISGAVTAGMWHRKYGNNMWYLKLDEEPREFNPGKESEVVGYSFITSFILYGYLIPISLYVCTEIVKIVQAMVFIRQDRLMFHEPTGTAAIARTSNINEELGMIDTMLSDKTGTLTMNIMEFFKASIAGVSYGQGVTEIERANARRRGKSIIEVASTEEAMKYRIHGFNFYDARLLNQQWRKQENADEIEMFFEVMAVCHTVIPEGRGPTMKFQAESPDEHALILAAKQFGFSFFKRTNNEIHISVEQPDGSKQEVVYEILHVLHFSSKRKRMSVIYRKNGGKLKLACKGADTVIIDRLESTSRHVEATRRHLQDFGTSGLRTLCLSHRDVSEVEYKKWYREWSIANVALSEREQKLEEVYELIEQELNLVGCTAIEDQLQPGVPQCIELLAGAGIRIWMLTGDKLETAINIGFACSLLRSRYKKYILAADTPELNDLERKGKKKEATHKASQMISRELADILTSMKRHKNSGKEYAMIIDGKALNIALTPEFADHFMDVCNHCSSVICCRVSPKQKAQVTELVKKGGSVTLAVGDGANDVGMIQAAHVGVGISGQEGRQAVMNSDFAIAQFCYLERLLLCHGRWNYKRLARMFSWFFYKNNILGVVLYMYNAFALFSGQTLFNDLYLSAYNIIFTSLPVLAIGIFDQDVHHGIVRMYPAVYGEGQRNEYFSIKVRSLWMLNSFYSGIIVSLFVVLGSWPSADGPNGQPVERASMGVIAYTVILITVMVQLATVLDNWTLFHHLTFYISLFLWFLFLVVYGNMSIDWSEEMRLLFLNVTFPGSRFWLMNLLVPCVCILPDFMARQLGKLYAPSDNIILQEVQRSETKVETLKNLPLCDLQPEYFSRKTTDRDCLSVSAGSDRDSVYSYTENQSM